MKCFALFACFLVCSLLLTGCAGYKLGPTNGEAAGAKSIQIKPFANKTLEPHLNDYLMGSLRKNLMQDGTYRLNTQDEGDLILSGVITGYTRSELSFQPTDVLTALDYQIVMTVQLTLTERSSGKVLLSKSVRGSTALRTGTDLTSAERQAMPQLTDNLARHATALLVDGTW